MPDSDLQPVHNNLQRRHSQSAPALLVLEELSLKTNLLNQRVSSLGDIIRTSRTSTSLPCNSGPDSTSVMVMDGGVKQRTGTCHACHAPLALHTQIPSGLNRCPLEHYEGCPGGYIEGKAANGSEWKGCPPDFVPGSPPPPITSTGSSKDRESKEDDLELSNLHINDLG